MHREDRLKQAIRRLVGRMKCYRHLWSETDREAVRDADELLRRPPGRRPIVHTPEVVRRAKAGHTAAEIAHELGVTERTIHRHLALHRQKTS